MSDSIPNIIQPSHQDQGALAKIVKLQFAQASVQRYAKLGNLFKSFHLKYAHVSMVHGREIRLNGKDVINFGSANYLGLEQNPDVIAASVKALHELGTHSGCSRVFFSHDNMIQLENEISKMMGAEATLVGHNISQIHAGVIPALYSNKNSAIFIDRFAHTSMYQASLIAQGQGAQIIKVDTAHEKEMENIILNQNAENKILMMDGIYSMQGHAPNLSHWHKFCLKNNILLYIDDAHGVGIYGENGGGVVEEFNLRWDNILVTGSLQKAFGTYGGFISGPKYVIDLLRVISKSYMFSGTLQPSAVEGARVAIAISCSDKGKELRKKLRLNSIKIRKALAELDFQVPSGDSPIIPVLIGTDLKTLMSGRKLFDLGIYLNSVLYPAVPQGEGILRISLTSLHTDQQIDDLILAFAELKSFLALLGVPVLSQLYITKELIKSKLHKGHYKGL